MDAITRQVFPVSLGNRERAFIPNKIFAVVSYWGHLSMKKFFQIGLTVLALNVDKGRVLGGGNHHYGLYFTYFSNHEDDNQSQQILPWSKIILR